MSRPATFLPSMTFTGPDVGPVKSLQGIGYLICARLPSFN